MPAHPKNTASPGVCTVRAPALPPCRVLPRSASRALQDFPQALAAPLDEASPFSQQRGHFRGGSSFSISISKIFVVVSPEGSVLISTFSRRSDDPEALDPDASGGSDPALYTPLMVGNFCACGVPRLDIGRGQPLGRLRKIIEKRLSCWKCMMMITVQRLNWWKCMMMIAVQRLSR